MNTKIATTITAGVLIAAALGIGGWTLLADPEPAAPPQAPAGPAMPDPLGDCDQLAGLATAEVVETGLCTTPDGGRQILVSAQLDCADGRLLHWNDYGWGYSDGQWQAHQRADGQLVPPDGDMNGC